MLQPLFQEIKSNRTNGLTVTIATVNPLRPSSPGILTDDRYRTIPEAEIVEMLLVAAFVYDLEVGKRKEACARVASSLNNWIKLGLGYRLGADGQRLFDPVEVINRMKWSGVNGLDDFWAKHFVTMTRAFLSEWKSRASVGHCGFGRHNIARFTVDICRMFDLSGVGTGQKLRLRLPLPISQSSTGVEVEPIAPSDLAARISRSEGRLDFQFAAPPRPNVEIGAKLTFSTDGHSSDHASATLSTSARDLYLRESEGLIRVNPRIRELSKQIAGTKQGPLIQATKLFDYVIDNFMCGLLHYDQISTDTPSDWVLDSGWYDCQLGSALFVSLCRAVGIPARMLSGHVLYRLAPGFHYWSEIWIDGEGWLPFDLLTWDLSEAGRDLPWRNSFAGKVDYRFVTQCFPLIFTGPMSIRFPTAWHLVNAPFGKGMEIRFSGLDGKLIYSDRISCRLVEA